MSVQQWASGIWIVPLADGPDLAEDIKEVAAQAGGDEQLVGVILDCSGLSRLNSACLSQLLQIHAAARAKDASLKLTALPRQLLPIFRQTGLDKLFDFCPDVSTALASLQLQADF
jgi:anti-anti-sigma factor